MTLSVFCPRWAAARAPGVVVLANRTAGPVRFTLQSTGQPARSETLPAGDLLSVQTASELSVEFGAGPAPVQKLTRNTVYFFLQPDGAGLELHEVGLDGAMPAAVAARGDEQIKPVGGIDPQLASGVITVKLLVDDEQRGKPAYWEKRLRLRVEQCSKVLQRQCGLRLDVVAIGSWQSNDGIQQALGVLEEFQNRVDPAPARLAVGVTSQRLDWNSAELHQMSVLQPLSRHILIPESVENMQPDAPFEILLHALGHWLGATHSPEAASAMRPGQALPDDVPTRRFLTYDPISALAMSRVAQELQFRGVTRISQVSPECRDLLITSYRTVRQLMVDDEQVANAFVQLGASAPAIETGADGAADATPVAVAPAGAAVAKELAYTPAVVDDLAARMATKTDPLRQLQADAIKQRHANWGHWGADAAKYSNWVKHSNRLIPIYTFGAKLDAYRGERSPYRSADALANLYRRSPEATLNPTADYFDQSAVYDLQLQAALQGKKNIILMVFDGMDWQTTWAAATYATGKVAYREGRGTGLTFQDYKGAETDYGFFVTSPAADRLKYDVNRQQTLPSADPEKEYSFGGYDPAKGGGAPWLPGGDPLYLIGMSPDRPHVVADSASTATTMCSGFKTYNTAINMDMAGKPLETIAQRLQKEGRSVGVVTSVPVSHATPAAAYANNVERHDYQDLLRDLVGLKSISHPDNPLPGVDVLIGCGWGELLKQDHAQGNNFAPGNAYVAEADLAQLDVAHGGKYRVAQRTPGALGGALLIDEAQAAARAGQRLFGFFGSGGVARPGTPGGHLPYRTADGNYNPTAGAFGLIEEYRPQDVLENPTLAEMTQAALTVLQENPQGFWLMVEAGDVDWANHDNNLDNSIGAVHSGDEAFRTLIEWIERRNAWSDTVLIVTADHGHHFVLTRPETIAAARGGK